MSAQTLGLGSAEHSQSVWEGVAEWKARKWYLPNFLISHFGTERAGLRVDTGVVGAVGIAAVVVAVGQFVVEILENQSPCISSAYLAVVFAGVAALVVGGVGVATVIAVVVPPESSLEGTASRFVYL